MPHPYDFTDLPKPATIIVEIPSQGDSRDEVDPVMQLAKLLSRFRDEHPAAAGLLIADGAETGSALALSLAHHIEGMDDEDRMDRLAHILEREHGETRSENEEVTGLSPMENQVFEEMLVILVRGKNSN